MFDIYIVNVIGLSSDSDAHPNLRTSPVGSMEQISCFLRKMHVSFCLGIMQASFLFR